MQKSSTFSLTVLTAFTLVLSVACAKKKDNDAFFTLPTTVGGQPLLARVDNISLPPDGYEAVTPANALHKFSGPGTAFIHLKTQPAEGVEVLSNDNCQGFDTGRIIKTGNNLLVFELCDKEGNEKAVANTK